MDQHQGDAFTASREEVGWFHAASDAAMGLHAQSIDGGGAGGCGWDDARSKRAHKARHSAGHRAEVARHAKIEQTLAQLELHHRADLRAVYTPFGAARTTWQAYCCFTRERRPLLGLALITAAIDMSFARAFPDEVPTFDRRLRWLESEVAHLDSTKMRPGKSLPQKHPLNGALWEAERREAEAMAAYDVLRIERERAAHRPAQELLARDRAAAAERDRIEYEAKLAAARAALWSAA